MKIVIVSTKHPWPTADGGRLLQALTLQSLASRGIELTLICPAPPATGAGRDPVRSAPCRTIQVPHAPGWPLPSSLDPRRPTSISRHCRPAIARELDQLLAAEPFDVVHVEQLQALSNASEPADRHGIPVVLRSQNVESDLWRNSALFRPLLAPWLLYQARLLQRYEGRAVRTAATTVTLSNADAHRLGRLSGNRGQVRTIAAPFPSRLPATERPLEGDPSCVVLGDVAWPPNRDALDWLLADIWPLISEGSEGARLHIFGRHGPLRSSPGVISRGDPEDSVAAFGSGSIFLVPLRVASGVRMKILEAWARGVPVVATPAAAAGLEARDRKNVLLAGTPADFVRGVGQLRRDPSLAERLVAGGRQTLVEHHDPTLIGDQWLRLYKEVIRTRAGVSGD